MIEPLPCRCICGTAARDQSQVPPTLVRNTASQSAGSVVTTVPPQDQPAAVISTSSRPCLRHNLRDRGFREIAVTDIAQMLRSVALRVANGCKRFLHAGGIAIDKRNERAFGREQHGAGAADAGPGPGDNRDPSLQPHVTFLPHDAPTNCSRSAAESAQPKRARQPNSCSMRDYRQRRAIGFAMQIDRRRFAGFGQPADETVMEGSQILSPLQRRPFSPGRDIVEAMLGFRRFDQQRHGVRDIRSVDPVPDARARQNGLSSLLQGRNDLHLRAWRVAQPCCPLPWPEHGAQPHADDIGLP